MQGNNLWFMYSSCHYLSAGKGFQKCQFVVQVIWAQLIVGKLYIKLRVCNIGIGDIVLVQRQCDSCTLNCEFALDGNCRCEDKFCKQIFQHQVMLIVNVYLCCAMTSSGGSFFCPKKNQKEIQKEKSITSKPEDFDPYARSWHGSQYGSR